MDIISADNRSVYAHNIAEYTEANTKTALSGEYAYVLLKNIVYSDKDFSRHLTN